MVGSVVGCGLWVVGRRCCGSVVVVDRRGCGLWVVDRRGRVVGRGSAVEWVCSGGFQIVVGL